MIRWRAGLVLALCWSGVAWSAEVSVAVAANFTAPMQQIAILFAQDTGHKAVLTFGPTGRLYAQIRNGAPFQLLLSADDETPERLVREGHAITHSRFTYAIGRLVLWSRQPGLVDDRGAVLRSGSFTRIALADPRLAPYGAAAVETLAQLGLLATLTPKFVQGESIAQTYQFVATENAPLGFVALAQVQVDGRIADGSAWRVPAHLHSAMRQDAVLLTAGKDKPAATALMAYLRSDKAQAVIRRAGYDLAP